jgi:AraC-like DNA-binding protein
MHALVTHAPSLRLALELLARFHPLLLDGVRVSLTERLDVATLRCEFPRLGPRLERSFAEMIVAGIERMLRVFGGTRETVHAVCFEHERPAHHEAYAAAFGGVERFRHGFTGVVFAAEILDRAHPYADPALETLLCSEAQRRLEQVRRPVKCGERVLAIMRTQPPGEPIVAQRVARELGISVRSLRRHLLDEGTSFRALAQSVLQETACAMLQDRELTIKAIADELGFADATAFHRAFKRWTQLTPCEYRTRLRWPTPPHLGALASSA